MTTPTDPPLIPNPPDDDQPQYEFTEPQNQVIGDLARKMQLVGSVLFVFGILGAITGFLTIARGGIGTLLQGIIFIFLGRWTLKSSDQFRFIVTTRGRDISHLMDALGNLRNFYALQYTLILVAIGLLILFVVIGLVAAVSWTEPTIA